MASRWWVMASIGLSTLLLLLCVWMLVADGYVRLFMSVAANQFICWAAPSVAPTPLLTA